MQTYYIFPFLLPVVGFPEHYPRVPEARHLKFHKIILKPFNFCLIWTNFCIIHMQYAFNWAPASWGLSAKKYAYRILGRNSNNFFWGLAETDWTLSQLIFYVHNLSFLYINWIIFWKTIIKQFFLQIIKVENFRDNPNYFSFWSVYNFHFSLICFKLCVEINNTNKMKMADARLHTADRSHQRNAINNASIQNSSISKCLQLKNQ